MLRILTAGEAHGPALVGILEGLPRGIVVRQRDFAAAMHLRKAGYGRSARMQIETDRVRVLAGVRFGETLGTPLAIVIENRDFKNHRRDMAVFGRRPASAVPVTCPRPGHADGAGAARYGTDDLVAISERASARETAVRVALAVPCRKLLQQLGVNTIGYVVAIGGILAQNPGAGADSVAELAAARARNGADFLGIDAAVLRGRLRVFVVVVLALILALGLAVSNHLLEPLAQLEVGLVRVAGGDLSARVRLERDDELGELATTFDRMIHDFEERQMLGRFVSGALDLDALRVERPGESGLQECLGVVLVSDMRDFTTLTEKHPARSIVSLLNRHHQAMAAAIQQCGGFVEHFIGDAVVGYFAEPGPGVGARRAVRAAWTMMQAHARLNAERSAAGEFNYAIGVGIDRGLLLVGAIGSGERRDRVLIGAPRDRAEHLEALSKKGHLSRIMVSPAVVRFCARSRFVALPDDDQTWELASWADDEGGEAAGVRA